MKTKLHTLCGLAALGLLLCGGVAASAQSYTYTAVAGWDGTTTNSVEGQQAASLIAGTYSNGISAVKHDLIGIYVAYKPFKNESNLVTLHWQTTFDSTYWPTTALGATNTTLAGVWTVGTGNNTNSAGWAVWHTNLPLNSVGYWRASAISNNMAAGSFITNVTIRAYTKPRRNG